MYGRAQMRSFTGRIAASAWMQRGFRIMNGGAAGVFGSGYEIQ